MLRRQTARVTLSIVVPVFEESDNLISLVRQIKDALNPLHITYELIFVDDHSKDGTFQLLEALAITTPLEVHMKQGEKGKSRSLAEGFGYAKGQYIAMIDGDLQYPPKYIPDMLKLLEAGTFDIVIGNRKQAYEDSKVRGFVSKMYQTLFGRFLWNMHVDIQSGLKVFRAEMLQRFDVHSKPWTFDLEFLLKARNAGYKIGEIDIDFCQRKGGQTKVKVLSTSYQIGKETLRLRFNAPNHIPFQKIGNEDVSGFHYKGKPYEPYNHLNISGAAVRRFSGRQSIIGTALIAVALFAFVWNFHATLETLIGALTILYFCDLLLSVLLVARSYYGFS